MKDFSQYLDEIERLKKIKNFNQAWKVANEGLNDLVSQGDEYWFDLYYQLADIAAREKKWGNALNQMALVIHYNGRLGGVSHEKFIQRLLKKINQELKFDEFIALSINTSIEELNIKIQKLLGI